MRTLLSLLLALSLTSSYASTVGNITFEGLTLTKESYLRKLISIHEGDTFEQKHLDDDLFLLRNLNLFFSADGEVQEIDSSQVRIVFIIREANYLYPIFSVSGFKDQLKIQAGANHINFLGKAQSFGAQYQFYDRHSFSIFHSATRHSNNRTGHVVALSKNSTIEPLYFPADPTSTIDTVSFFDFDNYSASIAGTYWLKRYLNLGLGGSFMYEEYHQRDNAFTNYDEMDFSFYKHQLHSSLNFSKIENLYERKQGTVGMIYGEWINTYSENAPSFMKLLLECSWHKLIGERGNISSRAQFGLSTNNHSPFAPFVLDGFINVRGIGNRVERGTSSLVLNTEFRHTFWKHEYVTFQAAGFIDYGALRQPGDSFDDFFSRDEQHIYTGIGIRAHLNVFYKTCLRVDYSVNPTDVMQRGFTFGFGQFF